MNESGEEGRDVQEAKLVDSVSIVRLDYHIFPEGPTDWRDRVLADPGLQQQMPLKID
jgi:hypothetical protein